MWWTLSYRLFSALVLGALTYNPRETVIPALSPNPFDYIAPIARNPDGSWASRK
jgi:hypothetical protein